MWWFLVLLGVLIALSGIAVIVLGVAIFVSTIGNTLITTGAVAASGGFVITAMGLVLRQLERLSARIDEGLHAMDAAARLRAEPAEPAPTVTSPRGRAVMPRMTAEDLLPPAGETEETEVAPEPAPERAAGRGRQAPSAPPVVPAAPRPDRPEEPSFEEPAPDPMVEARRQRLERRPEPPRAGMRTRNEPAAPRMAPSVRPPAPPAASASPAAPAARRDAEEPRILKSGIVGGMAYTLYSDGSIQADLPDGVVRFASLQELRDHVAQAQQER